MVSTDVMGIVIGYPNVNSKMEIVVPWPWRVGPMAMKIICECDWNDEFSCYVHRVFDTLSTCMQFNDILNNNWAWVHVLTSSMMCLVLLHKSTAWKHDKHVFLRVYIVPEGTNRMIRNPLIIGGTVGNACFWWTSCIFRLLPVLGMVCDM